MSLKNLLIKLLFILFAAHFPLSAEESKGTPFFLLSDATYGSDQTAQVRLEVENIDTVYEYGGVDVYLYRIEQPMKFLKAQKNLHRINVAPEYGGDTFANILSMVWDKLFEEAREIWRLIFSQNARSVMTDNVPQIRTHPLAKVPTPVIYSVQYKPLKQHPMVQSFRYPLHQAKPIQPPKGVLLEGSSSGFMEASAGNVMIPMGKLSPGLYLVEAMVGDYRATTLLFISDSVAITKVSSEQMAVWVAGRKAGNPIQNCEVSWSDGLGELAHGKTDNSGLVTFNRKGPEKSYVFVQDPKGGVLISENFYYDSEIYNTKLYAVTDRPLYRPGEKVYVKFVGRKFLSSRESRPIEKAPLKLEVFDPNALPVSTKTLNLDADGGETSFTLPNNAASGGYSLRFEYMGNLYGASFRVSEYQKPHFEINIFPDKQAYKTDETPSGKIVLLYPDGKPVKNAVVDLTLRSQTLTMSEGELGYGGEFPLKISNQLITTDAKGVARFTLPPSAQPSRYVLSVLATDGAAYRVRAAKELLIERSAGHYALHTPAAFSAPGDKIPFTFEALKTSSSDLLPVKWQAQRLEDRRIGSGTVQNGSRFEVTFNEPGTYTVSLLDRYGNILGARSHYVTGGSIKAPQGSIKMVFDKSSYRPGETAKALITFPEDVDQALLSLERDKVEKTALISDGASWVTTRRISPTQWEADVKVTDEYAPNITLSAVYVRNGEYVFQNLGLKVEQSRLSIRVRPDKENYMPGDKVTLDLTATVDGKASANTPLYLSVVDEMVYVLQKELEPEIFDFFYHPRRNNVRTSASLQFIGYDLAKAPASGLLPSHTQTPHRSIKLQERPRRDDKDTAFWMPEIKTDSKGHARVTFTMPDSLTRWRITVRGMNRAGIVGQNKSYILSDKPYYIKWTSPNWMRSSDEPIASVALFNQTSDSPEADLLIQGSADATHIPVRLKPGINFVSVPLNAASGTKTLSVSLNVGGKIVDTLNIRFKQLPAFWIGKHSVALNIVSKETPIPLPRNVNSLRVQFVDQTSEHFRRIMDDLIEYPYGCVEQTSSRIIPYTLAYQSLRADEKELRESISQRLYTFRFRLAQMAGSDASFGWWSTPVKEGDPFLSTYAYYADFHASKALGITLPEEHFNILLEFYRKNGTKQSFYRRALMLDWMAQMGLPVRSLAEKLSEELLKSGNASSLPDEKESVIMTNTSLNIHNPLAIVLTVEVLKQTHGKINPALTPKMADAIQKLKQSPSPLGRALLLLNGSLLITNADSVLDEVREESATIDRAVTLLWVYRALQKNRPFNPIESKVKTSIKPASPWQSYSTLASQNAYFWTQSTPPASLVLNAVPKTPMSAIVKFESAETAKSTIPVKIERKIYRLAKTKVQIDTNGSVTSDEGAGAQYDLILLAPDETMDTNQVYLDEIILSARTASPIRYALVEAALPPGTSADTGTWGINVRYPHNENYQALEKARFDLSTQGYTVPVDYLKSKIRIRHLIRPAQRGTFKIPPVRFFKMYQPDQKAFEETPRATFVIR